MLKIPKFNENTYFWSDTHLAHGKDFILSPRGFKNVEQAIATTFSRQQSTVPTDANMFLLGDTVVGAGEKSFEMFQRVLTDFNYGKIFVMPGNHYSAIRQILDYYGWSHDDSNYEYAKKLNFERDVYFIPNYYEIQIAPQLIVLSHYPIASFNHCSRAGICLHGHSHTGLYNTPLGKELYKMRTMDVGMENCPNPISYSEVVKKFKNIPAFSFDHH